MNRRKAPITIFRLARALGGVYGSRSYAREELVAELAAVPISDRLRIGCQLENHAAYLKDWAWLLREHRSGSAP